MMQVDPGVCVLKPLLYELDGIQQHGVRKLVPDLETNHLGSIHSSLVCCVLCSIKLASLHLSFFINKSKRG